MYELHDRDKRFNFGHLAIAFFTGALTAVAATLLTTPVSGRESRQHLMRFARKGKDALARTPDLIRRGLRRGKERGQGVVDDIRERIS